MAMVIYYYNNYQGYNIPINVTYTGQIKSMNWSESHLLLAEFTAYSALKKKKKHFFFYNDKYVKTC